MERITSRQNPRVKMLLALRKPEQRRRNQRFLVEGFRELDRAIQNHFSVECIFFSEHFSKKIPASWNAFSSIELSEEVFEKVSGRENPDGVLAVVHMPETPLPNALPENALIVVAEQIEKPGNLGAMLRSCESAGVDYFILAEPLTDLWNPNAIRASQGAIFGIPIAIARNEDVASFLEHEGVQVFATTPHTKNLYWNQEYQKSTAFLMGNEHAGLSDFWLQRATMPIAIPMKGATSDSLNVNVSLTLCLYEALRVRQNPSKKNL